MYSHCQKKKYITHTNTHTHTHTHTHLSAYRADTIAEEKNTTNAKHNTRKGEAIFKARKKINVTQWGLCTEFVGPYGHIRNGRKTHTHTHTHAIKT